MCWNCKISRTRLGMRTWPRCRKCASRHAKCCKTTWPCQSSPTKASFTLIRSSTPGLSSKCYSESRHSTTPGIRWSESWSTWWRWTCYSTIAIRRSKVLSSSSSFKNNNSIRRRKTSPPWVKKWFNKSGRSSRRFRIWFWSLGLIMNSTNANSSTDSRTLKFTCIACSKSLMASLVKVHRRSLRALSSNSLSGKSRS